MMGRCGMGIGKVGLACEGAGIRWEGGYSRDRGLSHPVPNAR